FSLISSSFAGGKASLPPGLATLPFIGNLLLLRSGLEPVLRSLHAKHGPVVTLHIGNRPAVFVADRGNAHQLPSARTRPSPEQIQQNSRGCKSATPSPFLSRSNSNLDALSHCLRLINIIASRSGQTNAANSSFKFHRRSHLKNQRRRHPIVVLFLRFRVSRPKGTTPLLHLLFHRLPSATVGGPIARLLNLR
ncbi:Cytochrome P450 89A9, partial [Linum perenne]